MVSGNSAAANTDSIVYNVMAAFHTACSSFMGQNWGAGNRERMIKSYRISLSYFVPFRRADRPDPAVFSEKASCLSSQTTRLSLLPACRECASCASPMPSAPSWIAPSRPRRGIGRSFVPTVIVILGSCVFRVIWVYTIFAHFHTIPSLYLLYAFSWAITALAETIYFLCCLKAQCRPDGGRRINR